MRLPFSFTSNSRVKNEAEYNAKLFNAALEEFTKVDKLVFPRIQKLHKSSSLAESNRQRLQDGRGILIIALKALHEEEDACSRIHDVQMELEDAQRMNAWYLNNNTSTMIEIFDKRVKDEESSQKRKQDKVRRSIRAFKKLCINWDKDKEVLDRDKEPSSRINSGPNHLHKKNEESRSTTELKTFFVCAFRILQTKSIYSLMLLLCIWQQAYDSSVAAASVYDVKRISDLKSKRDTLVLDIQSEGQKTPDHFTAANRYVVRDARIVQTKTGDMLRLQEALGALKLNKEQKKHLRQAKSELNKALKDMTKLRRRVEPLLPERSQSLLSGMDEDFDELPRPRKLIKKIFTRKRPEAESSDSSGMSDIARVPYTNF